MLEHSIFKLFVVYSAVKNGWSVRLVQNNQFEFRKNKSKLPDDYGSKHFIYDLFRYEI